MYALTNTKKNLLSQVQFHEKRNCQPYLMSPSFETDFISLQLAKMGQI